MSEALVLLSGGQDSTTALYWAKQNFRFVNAITFGYGQRHRNEIWAAERIAQHAKVPHETVYLPRMSGPLTWETGKIQATGGYTDNGTTLPTSYVPGRNLVFLAVAASRAVAMSCSDIVVGFSAADADGYPDCRESFVEAMRWTVKAAMPSSISMYVAAPLLYVDKADAVRLARELPGCWEALAMTITCYEGRSPGCGECPSCVLRAKGFAEAGEKDPAR